MSLYSDLNAVLTPYAQRIKGLAAANAEIKADLGAADSLGRAHYTVIPNGTDLNNIIGIGNYQVQDAATASSLLNTPVTNAGYKLTVIELAANRLMQIAYVNNISGISSKIYTRNYNGTTWKDWTNLTTKEYVDDAVTSLSDEISDFKSSFSDATISTVNKFSPRWQIGKGSSDNGVINNSYAAITAELFDSRNKYTYTGSVKDNNDKNFSLYIMEYDASFNWLRRVSTNLYKKTPPFDISFSPDCVYFRISFGRTSASGVTFNTEDLEYFGMTCEENKLYTIPVQPNPTTINTDGTINALFSIVEDYLNYAYQENNISGLVYSTMQTNANTSAYSPTIEPIQTVDGVHQYSIQCSGFSNLLIRAVSLANSRYMLGNDGENISQPWGFHFEDETPLQSKTYHNIVWSYNLLKYAVQHGFAYSINEKADNIRAGDLLFMTNTDGEHHNFQEIGHVMLCLGSSADGKVIIAHATSGVTRTSGGQKYPVALQVRMLDIANRPDIAFGARYPLGDVDNYADILYSSTVDINAVYSDNETIINYEAPSPVPKGLYTVILRGDFSATPYISIKYNGEQSYTNVGTMLKSGNIYSLTFYAESEMANVSLRAPIGGTTTTHFNYMAVAHGYISPNIINKTFPNYTYIKDVGYTISSNTNLNDITDIGTYFCSSSSIAQTLLNCPTTVSFTMQVINRTRLRKMQIIYNDSSNIFIRNETPNGYSSWYKFNGVEVT